MLSGDTLFVGDVARPDLAIEKSEGARGIFRSLHGKLLSLDDEVEVWPGHLGGSMCGGPGMDMKVSSTIGYERKHNATLAIEDEDEFVQDALSKLGEQPPNFQAIVALNRGPLLTDGVELLPLAPRQVEQQRADGALLVDVRTDLQFDEAHIPGARLHPAPHRRLRHRSSPGSRTASSRSSSSAATTTTRARPARLALAVGMRTARRLPARRHDLVAPGAPPGRPDRAHRGRRAGRASGGRPRELQVLDVRSERE